MDVAQYLERIGAGPVSAADLLTLRGLQRAHLHTVPFENLDIRRGHPISLDEEDLFDKIVVRRRGGICYEQNTLFAALLRALGFQVSLLGAEVSVGESAFGPPFDHMALLVALGRQRLLVDVGFGDSFLEPLELGHVGKQYQGAMAYEVQQHGAWHVVKQREHAGDSASEPSFRFQTEPRSVSDFDRMCLYHQSSPESHFTRKDICSRATRTGRITISGDQLIETRAASKVVSDLGGDEHRRLALRTHFGIVLAEADRSACPFQSPGDPAGARLLR